MSLAGYFITRKIALLAFIAAAAAGTFAQTPTIDCEATLRAWSMDRDPELRKYLATHTCTCPSSNSRPVCTEDAVPDPPDNNPPANPGTGSGAVNDAAAIEAERKKADAERKRKAEEFERRNNELRNGLKTGKPGKTGGNNPLGLKPGNAAPKQCWPGTRLSDGQCVADRIPEASEFLYTLQTRKFEPMNSGGKPIDTTTPPMYARGLVGGTTWTYGFKRPKGECDESCRQEIRRLVYSDHLRYCAEQTDPESCIKDGPPFNPDLYSYVVSMASFHTPLQDISERVLFDSTTYGEFSRQHQEMFADLKGKSFQTLDCHSNGAMLCLAALRSGDTKAREVRLFGPQINEKAAKMWFEYADKNKIKVTVFINNGDPVPAASMELSSPKTELSGAGNAAWVASRVKDPRAWAGVVMAAVKDSKLGYLTDVLNRSGLQVIRFDCKKLPNLDCHSMKLYEKNLAEWEAAKLPPLPKK